MGITYSFHHVVGLKITPKHFQIRKNPGKFHLEDRFDPKTGQKLASVNIIDERPSTDYTYDGKEYNSFQELMWEGGLNLPKGYAAYYSFGETEECAGIYVSSPKPLNIDAGRADCSWQELSFDDIKKISKKLDELIPILNSKGCSVSVKDKKLFMVANIG